MDYLVILVVLFILIYLARAYLAYRLVYNEFPKEERVKYKKLIYHIYGFPLKKDYDKELVFKIRIINLLSKACFIIIGLNFILIFITSLIRDM